MTPTEYASPNPPAEGFPSLTNKSPYPGLSPFQPEDSEYFFGRDSSVKDIVARLRTERFVVVIGGSGSGKSSLVLAGAIPRLRSFALPDAGDFWIPIVSTPGTNMSGQETPIRRLAGKFCAQLAEPLAGSENKSERLEQCVQLLREQGGLGKIIDRYGHDVRDLDGVDPANLKANYIFLIDQFEELFHRTNRSDVIDGDCIHLVNRIVEHSMPESRHPQVCVALTMRSEHLNDCPRYAKLPDAINKAFYLVRRLDESQISQAIQQPALRYLRKHISADRQARRAAKAEGLPYPDPNWPKGIGFSADLLSRLLTDANALVSDQDHADQLPLLQHLLFWIWEAARIRSDGANMPDLLTLKDLAQAVSASPGGEDLALPAEYNTLKHCLDNRCEGTFNQVDAPNKEWLQVFRSLAFKEPNTGSYTQQRAKMEDLSAQLVIPTENGFRELKKRLQPWLEPHRYLHWDTESSTIKVAHETLIRRWNSFRTWVDEDDRQFQIFMRLLDDCREWSKDKTNLAGGNSLLLYEDFGLLAALGSSSRSIQLKQLLEMDHGGRNLGTFFNRAPEFLKASLADRKRRHDEEENKIETQAEESRRKVSDREQKIRNRQYIGLSIFLFFILTWFVWALHNLSEKERMLHRSYALAAETEANFRTVAGDYDQPQFALRGGIQAAQFFADSLLMRTFGADWLKSLSLGYLFESRLDSLQNAMILSEARVTANLRKTLLGAPWLLPPTPAPNIEKEATPVSCSKGKSDGPEIIQFQGTDRSERKIIITKEDVAGYGIYQVSESCKEGRQIFAVPSKQGLTGIGIDADLNNVLLFFGSYFQTHSLDWTDRNKLVMNPRSVVLLPYAVRDIRALTTKSTDFGVDLLLPSDKSSDKVVRIFESQPSVKYQLKEGEGQEYKDLSELSESQNHICSAIVPTAEESKASQNTRSYFGVGLSDGSTSPGDKRAFCLVINKDTSNSAERGTRYLGDVFTFASGDAAKDLSKRVPIVQNINFGENKPKAMRQIRGGTTLAFQGEDKAWRAVPLTLNAWRSLAGGVFKPDVAFDELAAKAPDLAIPYNLIMSGLDEKYKLGADKLKKNIDSLPVNANAQTK